MSRVQALLLTEHDRVHRYRPGRPPPLPDVLERPRPEEARQLPPPSSDFADRISARLSQLTVDERRRRLRRWLAAVIAALSVLLLWMSTIFTG